MDLLPVALLMTVAIIGLLWISFLLSRKIGDGSRKNVFLKISKEYGLTLSSHSYPSNTILIKDKSYSTFAVTGVVHGHMILIEDTFTTSASERSFGYLNFLYFDVSAGRGGYQSMTKQTKIIVDGVPQILNGYVRNPLNILPHPAPYQEIKTALDSLT